MKAEPLGVLPVLPAASVGRHAPFIDRPQYGRQGLRAVAGQPVLRHQRIGKAQQALTPQRISDLYELPQMVGHRSYRRLAAQYRRAGLQCRVPLKVHDQPVGGQWLHQHRTNIGQLAPGSARIQRFNLQWLILQIQPVQQLFAQDAVEQQVGLANDAHCPVPSLASAGCSGCRQMSQRGAARIKAWRCACTSNLPLSATSDATVSPGTSGLAPEPWPALPPEFIFTLGPTRVTPPGSSLTKLPPTLKVISAPASSTTFMPLDR